MAGECADVLETGGDALLWSLMSGVSACETDLRVLGREDFWLIVTIEEWG